MDLHKRRKQTKVCRTVDSSKDICGAGKNNLSVKWQYSNLKIEGKPTTENLFLMFQMTYSGNGVYTVSSVLWFNQTSSQHFQHTPYIYKIK